MLQRHFLENCMDPKKWVRRGPVSFSTCQKKKKKRAGDDWDWLVLVCCSAILGVQPCPNTLDRREARPLAKLSPPRAIASPWGPKSSRPEASPQLTLPKRTRAKGEPHPNHVKNDQTRPQTRAIKSDRKRFLFSTVLRVTRNQKHQKKVIKKDQREKKRGPWRGTGP